MEVGGSLESPPPLLQGPVQQAIVPQNQDQWNAWMQHQVQTQVQTHKAMLDTEFTTQLSLEKARLQARLQGQSAPVTAPRPVDAVQHLNSLLDLNKRLENMHMGYKSYLEDLHMEDLEKTVSYEEKMAKKMVDVQMRRAAALSLLDYGDLGPNA